jgi:hypothetical protein
MDNLATYEILADRPLDFSFLKKMDTQFLDVVFEETVYHGKSPVAFLIIIGLIAFIWFFVVSIFNSHLSMHIRDNLKHKKNK